MSQPPEDLAQRPPELPVECTTSKVAPILDSVGAGYQLVRTGLAVSASEDAYRNSPLNREADIAFGVTLAAAFTALAIYGYRLTARCDEAKRSQSLRLWQERQRRQGGNHEPEQSPFRVELDDEEDEHRGSARVAPDDEGPHEEPRNVEDDEELSPAALERWGGPDDDESADDGKEEEKNDDSGEVELDPEALKRWGGPADD